MIKESVCCFCSPCYYYFHNFWDSYTDRYCAKSSLCYFCLSHCCIIFNINIFCMCMRLLLKLSRFASRKGFVILLLYSPFRLMVCESRVMKLCVICYGWRDKVCCVWGTYIHVYVYVCVCTCVTHTEQSETIFPMSVCNSVFRVGKNHFQNTRSIKYCLIHQQSLSGHCGQKILYIQVLLYTSIFMTQCLFPTLYQSTSLC